MLSLWPKNGVTSMLINEIEQGLGKESSDYIDDLEFFMVNDDEIYRRVLFPVISELRKKLKNKINCSAKMFLPCVNRAIALYCQKFNIVDDLDQIFSKHNKVALARKIFSREHQLASSELNSKN